MSTDNLQNQAAFIQLMLITSKEQQRALLKSLTPEQISVLLEILYNLYVLQHEDQDLAFFKQKKSFLRQFDTNLSARRRKATLLRRQATTLKVLNYFKSKILRLL